MPTVDATTVITTLTIAAGLALAIERTIELLKHVMGSASGTLSKGEIKELIERAVQAVKEAKEVAAGTKVYTPSEISQKAEFQQQPPAVVEPIVQTAADAEASEQHPAPAIPVIPPTPLSSLQTGRQLFYNLSAAGLGIILAHLFEIRMFALLTVNNGLPVQHSVLFSFFDIVFTGLVIGGGSQPIHALIRFLTEREVPRQSEAAAESKMSETPRDLETAIANARLVEEKREADALQWKDIVYQGGVNPFSLQGTHLRPAAPNLIVYHHTAMASSKSFQEIVDEFLLTKQWLTGYHCVIMPDGAIKPFCRWDRTGNHAMGNNANSLGISFHGNFHTELGDQYSNADGRYGNQAPTEAQLHAGARVVALWAHLYPEIKLDFERCIRPHRDVKAGHTVCPGSNFKYAEFRQLIRQYHQAWSESPEAQQKIAAFKQLDYVYA